jgi:hypothetical protein
VIDSFILKDRAYLPEFLGVQGSDEFI